MRARLRLTIWIVLAFGTPIATFAWLLALRGERILNNDNLLIGGWLTLIALLLCVGLLLRTTPRDAIKLSPATSSLLIIGTTAVLHLAALILVMPALSEDVLRYRLDGKMWLAGVSPYATAPAEFLRAHETDAIDRLTPFPQIRTIYPPTSQMIFAMAAAIERGVAMPANVADGSWRQVLPGLPLVERASSCGHCSRSSPSPPRGCLFTS